MGHHDDNFKDDSGILSIILGIVVLVGMSALPATILSLIHISEPTRPY